MKYTIYILALCALALALPAAEDAHAGHDHATHGDEGPAHELGRFELGGQAYSVTVHGEIEAGHTAVVSIAGNEARHAAELRVWIGSRNGRGSVKALLKADEHAAYHGHLEVPAELGDGTAFWCEMRDETGARLRASVALPAAHEHDEHEAEEDDAAEGDGAQATAKEQAEHHEGDGHDHEEIEKNDDHAGHDHD